MNHEDNTVARHLSEAEVYSFITGDFEGAGDCIASKSDSELRSRGNFLFAMLAMIFLEWASRLCQGSAEALEAFGVALEAIEPRYSIVLLGVRSPRVEESRANLCDQVTMLIRRVLRRPIAQQPRGGFDLPSGTTVRPTERHQQLLWVLVRSYSQRTGTPVPSAIRGLQ